MKEVADELITIQEMGKTSLVITHDYELIVSCCTHVLHLEHGVVQEQYALDATGLQLLKTFLLNRGDPSLNRSDLFFFAAKYEFALPGRILFRLSDEKRNRRWNSNLL